MQHREARDCGPLGDAAFVDEFDSGFCVRLC